MNTLLIFILHELLPFYHHPSVISAHTTCLLKTHFVQHFSVKTESKIITQNAMLISIIVVMRRKKKLSVSGPMCESTSHDARTPPQLTRETTAGEVDKIEQL